MCSRPQPQRQENQPYQYFDIPAGHRAKFLPVFAVTPYHLLSSYQHALAHLTPLSVAGESYSQTVSLNVHMIICCMHHHRLLQVM